jgi:hypothetical protein
MLSGTLVLLTDATPSQTRSPGGPLHHLGEVMLDDVSA